MRKHVAPFHAIPILLTAVAAGASAGVAAQDTAGPKPVPEVKIEAAHAVKRVGTTSIGVPIEIFEAARKVSYADLDLATYSGAAVLQKRINDAAKDACRQLDMSDPLASWTGHAQEDLSCIKDAVDHAMIKAKAAINAAEKAKKL